MRALSVHQPWASLIAEGKKTIETRQRATKIRGPLLIVSTKKPVIDGLPSGTALCVATLTDCRPMQPIDEIDACCSRYPNAHSWVLTNIRKIKPFPVKGSQGFYTVDDSKIQYKQETP